VEVRDLFGTLPARRKFLKRPATEFGHIAEVISRLALAVAHVGWTLENDGREALSFPPVAGPADRLAQVLGRDCATGVMPFEARTPAVTVQGYLGRPEHSLSSARLVLTYVAGRFVRDRVLTRAVLDGYQSVLMRGRYPVAVVFLDVAEGDVDVNVHPAKAEVRFRDPGRVHRLLAGAIGARLRDAPRSAALRGGVGAGGKLHRAGEATLSWPGQRSSTKPPHEGFGGFGAAGPGEPARSHSEPRIGEPRLAYGSGEEEDVASLSSDLGVGSGQERIPDASSPMPAAPRRFASLRIIGQVLEGYLVCESGQGLVLVDQHAAHERVQFERLRAQLHSGGIPVQHLLVPEPLTLGARDVQALEEAREALARFGFEGEPFGDGVYLLRAVPAVLADTDCAAVLRDVAGELVDVGASRGVDRALDAILAQVACHSAVRVGRRLDCAEAEALLQAMDQVERAGYCPHGRPAFVEIDRAVLERMFKR
jgi:DNA mismatch repair protein MutL